MSANNLEEVWAKSVAALEQVALLAKSQVAAYTRKDGTVVQQHDNGRQPTSIGKVAKLAASGWRKAAHKTVAGHHMIDSPAMGKDAPLDGVRRVSVLHGGHIAHFHYKDGDESDKAGAHDSAEVYARSRKGKEMEPYA